MMEFSLSSDSGRFPAGAELPCEKQRKVRSFLFFGELRVEVPVVPLIQPSFYSSESSPLPGQSLAPSGNFFFYFLFFCFFSLVPTFRWTIIGEKNQRQKDEQERYLQQGKKNILLKLHPTSHKTCIVS